MSNKKVVLAGAGTMGASLAQVYALGGWETYLYNRSQKGLDRAKDLIRINESVLVEENIITPEASQQVIDGIVLTTDKACFTDANLVVESIVEDLGAKQSFWAETSQLVPDSALLATNTSGLHITDIAKAVKLPARFVGQHWLNPPHLLPLCEIIVGRNHRGNSRKNARTRCRAWEKPRGRQGHQRLCHQPPAIRRAA